MGADRRLNRAWVGRWALGLTLLLASVVAGAGEVLTAVKHRGQLRCGVSEGIPGLSAQDEHGRWQGLDADFCRAVAAATLGQPDRVEFVPLRASARFPALQARRVDLLARNTSWTLTREAILKVRFPAVLLYDGQALMVPRSAGVSAAADLAGATVCVERGTTHEANLKDHFAAQGLPVTPLVLDTGPAAAAAFFGGRCRAYSSDSYQLAATRSQVPGGPQDYLILPERISREPLAPAVWGGDPEWETLVRWVLFTLIGAEAQGITRDNLEVRQREGSHRVWRLASGADPRLAQALGVPGDWALQALRAVGNYGEMYERNLGQTSPLGLDRGPNRPWTQGGLLYAPPMD